MLRRTQDRLLRWCLALMTGWMIVISTLVVCVYNTITDMRTEQIERRTIADKRWKYLEDSNAGMGSALAAFRQELTLTDQAVKINEKQIDLLMKREKK